MDYHVKESRIFLPCINTHTKDKDKKFLDEYENKGVLLEDLDV